MLRALEAPVAQLGECGYDKANGLALARMNAREFREQAGEAA